MTDHNKKTRFGVLRALSLSSQVGLTMASCVLIGVFGGRALDKWLNISPLFLLLCSLLGVGAAFMAVYKLMKTKQDK